MRRTLLVVSFGWSLACAGAPTFAPAPAVDPAPVVVPPAPSPVRQVAASCCRKPGNRDIVHEPRWDSAMCEDIGEWVEGRECEPTCCCKNELADTPFVRSTADWCADVDGRVCLAIDDPACG